MPHRLIAAIETETTDTSTKLTISYSLIGEDGERHESRLVLANEEAEYGPFIRARFDQFLTDLGFGKDSQGATSTAEQPQEEPVQDTQPATGENVVPFSAPLNWRRASVAASLAVGAVALTSVAASALDQDGDGVVSYGDLVSTVVRMAPQNGIQQTRVLDVHGVPHSLYWRVDHTDPPHPAKLITMVAEPKG